MEKQQEILVGFVDFLMPLLKPYETTIYLYLLRRTYLQGESSTVRVGIRTISAACGVGTRSPSGGNMQHIREVLRALEGKGCLTVGDQTREGTLYDVRPPTEVNAVCERIAESSAPNEDLNHYRDPDLRRSLFERDSWTCQYCGDKLGDKTITLDHYVPVSQGGTDDPGNLRTCCLLCNSIKSGKTYEQATPRILAAVRDRNRRSQVR